VLCGGGTGGHVYPALAVAEALRRKRPNLRLLYLGGDRIESRVVPAAGIPFRRLRVHGLTGRGLSDLLRRAQAALELLLCIPLIQSMFALRSFQADVVVGTGGYVTGPVLLAAHLLGIPSLTLEGNRTPGLTSKLVCRLADIIAVGWSDQARRYQALIRPRARIVATGLPIRRDLVTLSREQGAEAFGFDPNLTTLAIIGGSLGSLRMNEALVGALRSIGKYDSRLKLVQVLHMTGDRPQYARSLPREEAEEICPHYLPLRYLDEKYPHALAAADLVITRGGASTVAEVVARGLASIMIPWAKATTGEQVENVEPLRNTGAAIVILDSELTADHLATVLRTLLWDRERLQEMGQAARLLGKPHAAEEVAELALELAEAKRLKRGPSGGAAGRRTGQGRGATPD
jgi:UDP-N-acetylglucosamine--N-acetylmuramyl-(pentapeptide) pyrophosphoryl-undecaprenol N-acetylglucosamine transferase